MQGIHDVIMPFLGPKGNREKRSLDILKYIFGTATEEKNDVGDKIGYKVRKILNDKTGFGGAVASALAFHL